MFTTDTDTEKFIQNVRSYVTNPNLSTCRNVESVDHPTGWSNWSSYLFWARQNEFPIGDDGIFLDEDQVSETVYQMEREGLGRGPHPEAVSYTHLTLPTKRIV